MKTGFKNLDEIIEMKKGELIVIASRPTMGKTTLVLNISNYIALQEKKGVLFFSLENSKENIEEKLIISNSMVEKEKFEAYNKYKNKGLEKNNLLDDDRDRIEYGINLLKNAPIYIESNAPFSINDICLKSRQLKEKKDIEVIIIDYLQLIQFDKKKLLSRDDEITEILRKLKVLAKELDVPVIVTSQLSRNCENRDDKRPMIADFTNSKYGINTYSNKILFIYRDSYYNEENKSNTTEIIVAKNNGGEISNIKIAWLPEYYKFGNVLVLEDKKGENMINDKKEELKDDYSLINSNAIANYCRSIEYKFNTEELAVLVFRNKKISIKEKIAKYDDLIKNYSDMEVIERINCKHYDSVKTLIKNEIQRLKKLEKRLMLNEENSICAWAEYNKSTKRKAYNLDKTFKTFDEALKDIQLYIKEFNDTISFTITKKYFDKRKNIHAEYIIKNQKIILNNLVEEENEFLDIDQIFLNIPTPFKRGDILIANNAAVNSVGEEKIFVLDYLCTWRNGLNEYLAKGNCDSSDMIGYGYYFVNENTTEFVIDHQWDYDSFEYYNMELTGKYRILKAISSFIKGEISLELFIHSYDMFKAEFKRNMPEFYTDEGLKLAGMTDKDIFRINHSKK